MYNGLFDILSFRLRCINRKWKLCLE